jgi:signal peptidase I
MTQKHFTVEHGKTMFTIGVALIFLNFLWASLFFSSQSELTAAIEDYRNATAEYNRLIGLGHLDKCNVKNKVNEAEITLNSDYFTVHPSYGNLVLLEFANNSYSMSPTVAPSNYAIAFVPHSEDDIRVCDVISYNSADKAVFHRILSIEADTNGVFYTVKGDNNSLPDPVKVRFSSINYVMLAVVY